VIASLGSALVVLDAHGRRLMSNPAYDDFLAVLQAGRVEDLDGRPLPASALIERWAARGDAFTANFAVVDPDGARHWFEAVGNPLRDERQPDGALGHAGGVIAIRDMTDHTLRRLQDEFLATASHELRTPITAISLYAGLLTRLLGSGGDSGQTGQILDGLALEARRMNLLVNDLMDVGRLQTGQVRLTLQRVDIAPIVRRAGDLAQHLANGQQVRVDVPDTEVWVDADPSRLEQVLVNLLENAIIHAEGTQDIDVRVRAGASQVEVVVRDYGAGIPEVDLPHVFDRFYRSALSKRRLVGGLGLGLYISHQLAVAHGGSLDVQSVEGSGATFTLLLPLARADATGASGPRGPA